MKKIKIGIVGLGFITDWHYNGFKTNTEAEIVGICNASQSGHSKDDSKIELLNKKCLELNLKPYDSFERMVEDPAIDALIIGSINPYHYQHIKAAVEHGKHIMVEKPVLTDFDQLDEIELLSAQNGVKIFPAHNFVYRTAVRKAKELIDAGKLGKIIHSSFLVTHTISDAHSKGWRAKKELSMGGALMDSGHHLIYQSLFLLGKPLKLQAFASKMVLKEMDCEDTAQVSLLYADGSMAVIMQSWASNQNKGIDGIRIFGTEGSVAITDALYFNNEQIELGVDYLSSFVNQSRAFTDFILSDIPPISGLKDARDSLRITFAAYESACNNTVIDF